jgi:anti-sigma factor RsiW
MPRNRPHPGDDEIQEAVDGRLPAAARLELEAHLATCDECRRKWEIPAWAKAQAASAPHPNVPEDLSARVVRALDEEDADRAAADVRGTGWSLPGRAVWVATVLAAVLLVVVLIARRPDMPQAVARDYEAWRTGALALDVHTEDIHDLEVHLSKARLPFPVRVLDLGMMRYRLVGGKVHDLNGRPGALLVYEGADGHTLLCEMHRGSLIELPSGGERHEHGGITFLAFRRGRLTLVFWPEGDVLCVLAGEGGPETILPLAFAKAMKATRRSAFSLLGASDGAVNWRVSF